MSISTRTIHFDSRQLSRCHEPWIKRIISTLPALPQQHHHTTHHPCSRQQQALHCRYTNRDDLDFAAVADMPPVQEWDLQDNAAGLIEYPTQ